MADRDQATGATASAAQAQVGAQRRLLDEIADANRSAWAWFPPIFVIAFSLLSFAGTYIGLRDIISTGDLRYGALGDALVVLLVMLATGAMVFFLRRAVLDFFSLGGVASFGAYLLLLFFSVTFGFAFYWGRLEASGQALSGAQSRMEEFSDDIQTSAFALRSTADGLTRLAVDFRRLAEQEREVGGTCGDNSPPGPGPRMRHRERRAAEIETRVKEIQPRFAVVQGPVASLEAELKKIEALAKPGAVQEGEPGAVREAQFQETRRAARRAAVEINALAADASLAALAVEFKRWGAEYQDPSLVRRDDPQGASYQCIEPGAGRRLQNAGERLANLPRVAAPDLPDYAGAEATREAVFRMLDSASGFIGGGPGVSALFSEEASSLTPRGEAALRSSVGQAVRDAGTAGAPVSPETRGLRPADRFPLAIAFIIDMLLFAFVLIERPGRKYFDRMKRRVSEAIEEEFNPLQMVALREALNEDPDWRLLRQYRFDVEDRTFIALPADGDEYWADGSELSDPERLKTEALRDVVKLWRRNGILRPAFFKPEQLQELLRDAGRRDLIERWRLLDCYEFSPRGFERLLLSGMTEAKRQDLRETRAARRAWMRLPRRGGDAEARPRATGGFWPWRSESRPEARRERAEALDDEPLGLGPADQAAPSQSAADRNASDRQAAQQEAAEAWDRGEPEDRRQEPAGAEDAAAEVFGGPAPLELGEGDRAEAEPEPRRRRLEATRRDGPLELDEADRTSEAVGAGLSGRLFSRRDSDV